MAYQPLKVIKCLIHLYTNKQFYFKQVVIEGDPKGPFQ